MDEPLPFHPARLAIDAPYELRGARADNLEAWDRHVIVDVVHDGVRIPPTIEPFFDGDQAVRSEVHDTFVRERDWGAAAVAERLAHHLGLRGYYCIQAARVVCDYNRFRGRSVPEAGHLGRRALFGPGNQLLSGDLGEHALQTCFDPVTQALFRRASEAIGNGTVPDSRMLRVTVHTYDDRAGEGHRRPKTSIIFTPYEYHEASRLPAGVYVPIFPDRLAEFTADRALAYRMALMLEKNYLPVAVNSPYFLPLGGAEMRLQVWCYMQHLKRLTQTLGSDGEAQRFEPLWPVVEDVDRPWGSREIDPRALMLLDELEAFIERHRYEAVERYRYSAYRPCAIEVEVRKDIVYRGGWKILSDGFEAFVPDESGLRQDEVDRVASVMAAGIRKYLIEDQPEKRAGAHLQ